MKEHLIEYLTSEKLLGLSAGLIGVGSILVGLYFLIVQKEFKGFAWAMILLGLLESGIFLKNFFQREKYIAEKVSAFEANPAGQIEAQKKHTEQMIRLFFWLKLSYALSILLGVIVLSKFNLNALAAGILTAFILHAGLAATIDNFGEQHTKKFLHRLNSK